MGIEINGVSGSQYFSTSASYLSIDELVQFCAQKMQSTDDEIRALTTKQNEFTNNAKALADAQRAIDEVSSAFSSTSKDKLDNGSSAADGDGNDAHLYTTICESYNKLADAANNATGDAKDLILQKMAAIRSHLKDVGFENGDPVHGKILKLGQNQEGALSGDVAAEFKKDDFTNGDLSGKSFEDLRSKFQNDQALNMINVQSAVSKREQNVQLITNLVQKMSTMAESVIQNIGK